MNQPNEASTFIIRFSTILDISVEIVDQDRDRAEEIAWERAQSFLQTIRGDSQGISAIASIDGVGPYEVEQQ